MKKRLLAFALATAMMFSSVNVAFAEDAAVAEDTVIAEETAVPDDVESDAAVEEEPSDGSDVVVDSVVDAADGTEDLAEGDEAGPADFVVDYPHTSVAPWTASVMGAIGNQQLLGHYTSADAATAAGYRSADKEYAKNSAGTAKDAECYEISGTEESVHMRAGTLLEDHVTSSTGDKGKIASSEEGAAFYYQPVDPSADFVLTAKAKVIGAATNGNGQEGFGLAVRDKVVPNTDYKAYGIPYDDEIGVGKLLFNADHVTKADVQFAWTRSGGALDPKPAAKEYISSNPVAPAPGEEFDLTLRKSGDIYTLISNKDRITIDNREGKYNLTKEDPDHVYVGLIAARCVDIEFTNVNLEILPEVESIQLTSLPTKRDYRVDEPFDPTGLEIQVQYVDGSSKTFTAADVDDYSIIGFDDAAASTFKEAGERELTVAVGAGTATFTVNVTSLIVDSITVKDSPVKLDYYVGNNFDPFGFKAIAGLNDGQTKELSYTDVEFTMDGEVITKDTVFTAEQAGTHTITVTYRKDDKNITPGDASATFNINVSTAKLVAIRIIEPSKKTFYTGQELNVGGLVVTGIYSDNSEQLLTSDEYDVVGFDSSVPNPSLKLTVVVKADPSITASFNVAVDLTEASNILQIALPRTTYNINETFTAEGMLMRMVYTDGSIVDMPGTDVCYKSASGYYTMDVNGNITAVDEDTALAKDFYMDTTAMDNSKAGAYTVTLVINKTKFPKLVDQVLNVAVVEPVDYLWKASMMGPSATDMGDAAITVTDASEKDHKTTVKNAFGALPDVMIDGKIPNVEKVHIDTWNKAGKIATDQDGIAYYYTEIPNTFTTIDGERKDINFELSANVRVNRYMAGKNDFKDASQRDKYDKAIAAGFSDAEAMDQARDGQEAFGIMARDTIQLAGGVVDGEYRGNAAKSAITSEDAAKLYYVFDADNICQKVFVTEKEADDFAATLGAGSRVFKSDATMYEAQGISFGDVLKANNGQTYQPVDSDVAAVAVSNVIIAGGVTDGTFPTDPDSSTYWKKYNMNRINILVRSGVTNIQGLGSSGKNFAVSSTDKIPETGDVYNITLRKFNKGYQIITKMQDPETGLWGTPRIEFAYDADYGTSGALTTQYRDKYYVGFFTCRWADIDVSDIQLHVTDPNIDTNYEDTVVEKNAPRISFSSSAYTPVSSYQLEYKVNGDGLYSSPTIVSHNDKRIAQGSVVHNKTTRVPADLVPNSVNKFTVVLYPNTNDPSFSNYNTVVSNFYVTHNNILDSNDTIYVSPDGLTNAPGTRQEPTDLETALNFVKIGGTIVMLDGTYNLRNDVEGKLSVPMSRSAIPGKPITVKADEGAEPVIDLEKKYVGFEVDADYWIFNGLTIINSKDNEKAFGLGGDHCIVEYCTFHDNGTTAFQISRIKSDDSNINTWPAYNIVRHCESFNNFDPSQNNADGFAAKLTVGYGNVFQDCISHHNADDGWDCYTKIGEGAIGASVLENCVSYKQKHVLNPDGSEDQTKGSGGNGYKLGGEDIYVKHYLKDCITFENGGNGVDSNNNPAIKVRNVIAYANQGYNFGLYGNPTNGIDMNGNPSNNNYDEEGRQYKYDYDLEGAVSAGGTSDRIYTWNVQGYEMYANLTPIEKESNYLKKSSDSESMNINGEVLNEATFFKSTDKTTVLDSMQRYSRKQDGSFEHGDFLARVTPYDHKKVDEVILPDTNGGTGNVGGDKDKDKEPTTEPATTKPTPGKGSGGGGGGGGGVKITEATTEANTATDNNESAKKPIITKDVKVTIGASEIVVGDQTIPVDASAYIQASSDSTLVPLRFVAIAILGGDVANADTSSIVKWDGTAKAATIVAGDDTIVFTADSADMVINGEAKTMANGVKAEIVDGRMYVPFRALGDALGVDVEWDAETKTASYIAPAVEEEPAADGAVTKEAVLQAAEALDSILSISADRANAMAGPEKKKYTEMSDKLATILMEAAYDMTDEEIAAATDLLTGELLTYITEDLPKKVSTVEETAAKVAELKDAFLAKAVEAPAEAEAE